MSNTLLQIFIAAILVEAVWDTLQMMYEKENLSVKRVGALVVGLLVAFSYSINIPEAVGLNSRIPFIGIIMSGIIISRGANFTHDLLDKMRLVKDRDKKAKKEKVKFWESF